MWLNFIFLNTVDGVNVFLNYVLTFLDIVTIHIDTEGSRSYSTSGKVVSQSQIVPSNPNAATLFGVELFVRCRWRNLFVNFIRYCLMIPLRL